MPIGLWGGGVRLQVSPCAGTPTGFGGSPVFLLACRHRARIFCHACGDLEQRDRGDRDEQCDGRDGKLHEYLNLKFNDAFEV